MAGCFHCCAVYPAHDIEEWVAEPDGELEEKAAPDSTALCAKCGIDSVIGDASGFAITEVNFLKEMNRFWFS